MTDNFGKLVKAERERRGWSQQKLAALSGATQSTIDRIEAGLTLYSRAAPRIAQALDVPFVLKGQGNTTDISVPIDKSHTLDEIPLYAAVEGGPGEIIINKDPLDYIPRPEPLHGTTEGYAVYVVGDSMSPSFRPGEKAIVHNRLPPIPDETCIFYTNDGANDRATIKHLTRITLTHWHVEQYNPPNSFTLDRKEWPKCHRVIARFSRR